MAFRLIGKGFSAPAKFCSILGLSQPISKNRWAAHTKVISKKANEVLSALLSKAATEVRAFKEEIGQSELNVDALLSVATSFDGSLGSRGWSF